MTKTQYLKALKDLGLLPSSQETARILGVSVRQCQRLAAGEQQVTPTIANLLAMYAKRGIPKEMRE